MKNSTVKENLLSSKALKLCETENPRNLKVSHSINHIFYP